MTASVPRGRSTAELTALPCRRAAVRRAAHAPARTGPFAAPHARRAL